MRKLYLFRHGKTRGNLERRYIGSTDEPLCREGRKGLEGRTGPGVSLVFASPMKRCLETAGILYPGQVPILIPELAECDFGLFENRNYEELCKLREYRRWIGTGGREAPPGGESRRDFQSRVLAGFQKALAVCERKDAQTAALVVHGGTIMGIMEAYAVPQGDFYDYQIRNGEGYELILADDASSSGWISAGSSAGRSGMAVSSGAAYGEADHRSGTNYQKITAGNAGGLADRGRDTGGAGGAV